MIRLTLLITFAMRNCLLLALCLITGLLSAQTVDSVALRRVDSLIETARRATDKRDYAAALQSAQSAESLAAEKTGRESAIYAQCCTQLGGIFEEKEDWVQAEKWYDAALVRYKKLSGEDSPDYAIALKNCGALLRLKRDYKKAEPLLTASLVIINKHGGKAHPSYNSIIDNLSDLYCQTSRFPRAKEYALEVLELDSIQFGKENVKYGIDLKDLAIILGQMSRYAEAEGYLVQAQTILAKTVGASDIRYADCVKEMASLKLAVGDYKKAKFLCLEALAIYEKALGRNNRRCADVLNALGIIHDKLEEVVEAEQYYLEALKIREATNGKNANYAFDLSTLGSFYKKRGAYERAEKYYLEARDIFLKTEGPDQQNYALTCMRLGNVYFEKPDYAKAEAMQLEAKAIFEKIIGPESGQYAAVLNNLGNIYTCRLEYAKSEAAHLEAAEIRKKLFGENNVIYAGSLENLGLMFQRSGQNEKALTHFTKAQGIYLKNNGPTHPLVIEQIHNLARTNWALGRLEAATTRFMEANLADNQRLRQAATFSSESEMLNFLRLFAEAQAELQTFTMENPTPELSRTAYNNALFYKGFLSDNARLLVRSTDRLDSMALVPYKKWQSMQKEIAAELAQPLAKQNPKLAALTDEAESLEKQLTRSLPAFEVTRHIPTWTEVRDQLRPGESAIEFVSFSYFNKNTQRSTDSIFYATLVLQPGSLQPQFIPLFEEKQLTALLKTEGSPQPTFYNDLYSAGKKGDQLYDLIWKPIAAALPQGTTVYCSPSGLLHRLNLGAIPTPDGKTLSENNRLTILGSTRQLVIPSVTATQQSTTAQLYGGIQYDATPTVAINTPAKPEDLAARRGPDIAQNDSTLRGENWNYLRWTEVEISAAANVMKSKGIVPTLKKGTEATEESFKALGQGSASPRILHLATHGFFFPDPKELKPGEGQAIGEKTFKVSDNPMIRSGLLLAGGNHAWKTGKPLRPDLEDGILTAYEISQMNLANTELVVLSACETGLGDLVGNEGVYGLQRAFKIAGAKYLIMSLWQVPDFQTQVFMTAFYKHWLEGKMAVPAAFRATQAELRLKYSGEAFKWAGFVLVE
jgi:CHAT domain-containing protein